MTSPIVRFGALTLLGIGALCSGAAFAQSTKPASPPAASPAAPGQPQSGGVKLDLVAVDPNWTKVCNKDPAGKDNCVTGRVFGQSAQQPSLTVMIYQSGEDKRFARFNLPVGLLLRPGFRLVVDKGDPIEGHYVICFQGACIGEADLSNANVSALKKGANLAIITRNSSNYEVTFNAPIKDFGAAYDGPSVDPKVIEQQNAELQKRLEDQARKQREQLEKQQGGAAPAATPSASPTPAKP
jgi:invasion protein IalB